jgi:hypothetical protein
MSEVIWMLAGLKLQTPLEQLEVGKEGLPPLFVDYLGPENNSEPVANFSGN